MADGLVNVFYVLTWEIEIYSLHPQINRHVAFSRQNIKWREKWSECIQPMVFFKLAVSSVHSCPLKMHTIFYDRRCKLLLFRVSRIFEQIYSHGLLLAKRFLCEDLLYIAVVDFICDSCLIRPSPPSPSPNPRSALVCQGHALQRHLPRVGDAQRF
jgi:hypothetical protein